jgi:hypothetical protein
MANDTQVKEIRKSILILKTNPMALQSAEIFLNTREWEVYSVTTLQEAVKIVLTKNPEYLLICANHPQKKVKSLPKILSQAIPIKVILYVDVSSALNVNLMNQMGFPNHILPPVSGPAIERAVFKFEKDELQKINEKKKILKESMGSYSITRAEPPVDLEFKLNQMLGTPDDDAEITESRSPELLDEQDGPPEVSETFAEWEARKRRERSARMADGGTYIAEPDKKRTDSSGSLGKAKPDRNLDIKSPDSVMVKGAQHALDSSIKVNQEKTIVEKLEKSQNCICIVIDSTRFSGYLIAAMGRNRRFDDEFVKNIQTKLYEFLKSQGETLDEDGALEIKIKTVEFEDWALEQAEFLKKSVHDGDEVAMAFFPAKKTTPDVEKSAREDMLSINIDDLEGDIQVLFDVYIYLPTNQKYVLYTPKGGTFMGNQKDRLKGKGITHMHMKKDEIGSAKKYTAQNYLNNKVDEFNQSRTEDEKKKSS